MKFMFKNKSGETYPAYGIGRLKSVLGTDEPSGNPLFELVKPDGEEGIYVVNGPNNVINDDDGVAIYFQQTALVLIDDGSTTDAPAFGDVCGPTESRWAATTTGTGLKASGEQNERTIPVVASSAATAGAHIMWFVIDQVLCPDTDYVENVTLVVTPEDYTGGCNGEPPGADEYGVYRVYDKCGYFNGLTKEELLGTIGRATWMYPLTGDCEPRWLVDDLCAQPECNDPEDA